MITIIENVGGRIFIEGIFLNKNDAEAYLKGHPGPDKCILKELDFNTFPFCVAETRSGFSYFASIEQFKKWLKYLDKDDWIKSRTATFFLKFPDLRAEEVKIEEKIQIMLFIIAEPIAGEVKNQDNMGEWEHGHFDIENPKAALAYVKKHLEPGRPK